MSNSSLLRGSREVLSHLRGEDWRINKGSHIHVPLPSTEQLPSLSPRHQRRSFSVHKPCRGLSLLWPGLLLSRPKKSYSAGTKSVSPMTCTSTAGCCCTPGFSPQLRLPTLAAAGPRSYGALSPDTRDWVIYIVLWIWGNQNSRAIFSEHDCYCSAPSFIHRKKYAAGYPNLVMNPQVQTMTVFWKMSQWPRSSAGSLRGFVEFQHYFMKKK